MTDPAPKQPVFHRPALPVPPPPRARPAASRPLPSRAPERASGAPNAEAVSDSLDPRIIWLVGGAAGFTVALAALGIAAACGLFFGAALIWLVWQRQRLRGPVRTSPGRRIGWALVALLLLASGFFFWNAARLSAQLQSPEARSLAALSTSSTMMRYAPDQAAAGISHLRTTRDASDLSGWLAFGALGVAVLGAIVMAATAQAKR